MRVEFTENAWEDFNYWLEFDKKISDKILSLIKEITRTPFSGTCKPEALRGSLTGYWSRRINKEHRIVYRVTGKKGEDQRCTILQCRFHY